MPNSLVLGRDPGRLVVVLVEGADWLSSLQFTDSAGQPYTFDSDAVVKLIFTNGSAEVTWTGISQGNGLISWAETETAVAQVTTIRPRIVTLWYSTPSVRQAWFTGLVEVKDVT